MTNDNFRKMYWDASITLAEHQQKNRKIEEAIFINL